MKRDRFKDRLRLKYRTDESSSRPFRQLIQLIQAAAKGNRIHAFPTFGNITQQRTRLGDAPANIQALRQIGSASYPNTVTAIHRESHEPAFIIVFGSIRGTSTTTLRENQARKPARKHLLNIVKFRSKIVWRSRKPQSHGRNITFPAIFWRRKTIILFFTVFVEISLIFTYKNSPNF